MAFTSLESAKGHTPPVIPSKYQDLKEVFNKAKASGLSLHHPYDCAIELLPGATPPHNRIYPMSMAEQQVMEEYMEELLKTGNIQLSSSGFFFMEKKGCGLRPCITIKYRYSPLLIPVALEQLCFFSHTTLCGCGRGDAWNTAFSTTSV